MLFHSWLHSGGNFTSEEASVQSMVAGANEYFVIILMACWGLQLLNMVISLIFRRCMPIFSYSWGHKLKLYQARVVCSPSQLDQGYHHSALNHCLTLSHVTTHCSCAVPPTSIDSAGMLAHCSSFAVGSHHWILSTWRSYVSYTQIRAP